MVCIYKKFGAPHINKQNRRETNVRRGNKR